jgi:hypothetical protein
LEILSASWVDILSLAWGGMDKYSISAGWVDIHPHSTGLGMDKYIISAGWMDILTLLAWGWISILSQLAGWISSLYWLGDG